MSSSFGFVRFPDGQVLVGLYSGTSDIFAPGLTSIEEWAEGGYDHLKSLGSASHWNGRPETDEETAARLATEARIEAAAVDVDIYADYGRGTYWRGRASFADRELIDGFTYGYREWSQDGTEFTDTPYENGCPGWASEASTIAGRLMAKHQHRTWFQNGVTARAAGEPRETPTLDGRRLSPDAVESWFQGWDAAEADIGGAP